MMSVYTPPSVVLSALPGFGPEFRKYTEQLPYLAMFGGLLHDDPGGRIRRGPGREPLMTYRMSDRDRSKLPKIVRRLGEAYLNAGAVELFLPILGHDSVTPDEFRKLDLESVPAKRFECSSQHPLGTTRMGVSPESSVVDEDGKCWEVEELYVADGGVLPTSLGVNPQLSIMTVALRIAQRMAERSLPDRV
jgi:choline dehydrogenase-like flavoprotein